MRMRVARNGKHPPSTNSLESSPVSWKRHSTTWPELNRMPPDAVASGTGFNQWRCPQPIGPFSRQHYTPICRVNGGPRDWRRAGALVGCRRLRIILCALLDGKYRVMARVNKMVASNQYVVMGWCYTDSGRCNARELWMAVQLSTTPFNSEAVGWVRWTYKNPN